MHRHIGLQICGRRVQHRLSFRILRNRCSCIASTRLISTSADSGGRSHGLPLSEPRQRLKPCILVSSVGQRCRQTRRRHATPTEACQYNAELRLLLSNRHRLIFAQSFRLLLFTVLGSDGRGFEPHFGLLEALQAVSTSIFLAPSLFASRPFRLAIAIGSVHLYLAGVQVNR